MTLQKPTLIIIPGLGDRVRGYSLLAFAWKILGYDTQVFSFKWEDEAENFSTALDRLLGYIDDQPSPVYIIGASAGGSAAISALHARSHMVEKIVTVAAAPRYIPHLKNSKLKDAIDGIPDASHPEIDQRILSVYGLYDQKVSVRLTKQLKGHQYQIPMIGHAMIIFTALTVYSYQIHRFLRKTRD